MITSRLMDRNAKFTRLLCLPQEASAAKKLLLAAVLAALGALTGCADARLPGLTSITLTPPNSTLDIGQTQQYAASGTFSDGTTRDISSLVTWSSSNTTVASISASGLALGIHQGSSTISATLNTADGPVTGAAALGVIVTLTSLTITPVNPSIANGTSLQLTATGIFSDGSTQNLTNSVNWTSSTPAVATVTGSGGLVTGASVGSTTITATQGGVSATTTVTVTSATLTSITITPANSSIAAGSGVQLTATGNFSDGTTQDLTPFVTWASSSPQVTVSNTGFAMGSGVGSSSITATQGGVSGMTTVTVTAATLTSITVIPVNPSIANGTTVQLKAIGTFSDGSTQNLTTQVMWTSSSGMATVDSSGLVTGKAVGSAPITATLGGVSGGTTVTVTAAILTSITVTPANPSIPKGFDQDLTAIGTFSDGSTQNLTTSVTWASSDPSVTVSNAPQSQGVVTGNAVGSATVVATQAGVAGTTTVTVTAAILTSISVTPSNESIIQGGSTHLTATGKFSDGSILDITDTASWISSNPAIATVGSTGDNPGLVTGIAAGGPITITATQDMASGSATVTVTPEEIAYVTNDTDNSVTVFSVNPNTGALTQIFGSPFANPGSGAASVTADPSGRFLYTANQFGSTGNSVTAYSITPGGPGIGALTLIPTPPPNPVLSGAGAFSVAVEPSGHFAYVGNVGNNSISGFAIASNGALTPVTGSPFSALPATGSQGIATHPNDQFVYVTDSGSGQVGVFAFNHTSGAVNLPGMLFGPPATDPIRAPVSITLDPLGRFAYTANNLSAGTNLFGSVSAYAVTADTGALTFVENVAAGSAAGGPAMVAVDPTGSFAYVAGGGQVAAFNINSDGSLTAISGSPFSAGLNTFWVAVDPSGKFVYVADHGDFGSTGTRVGGVSAYRINPATGALMELTGSPFMLPRGPTSITVVAVP